jgi:hypothetical protein
MPYEDGQAGTNNGGYGSGGSSPSSSPSRNSSPSSSGARGPTGRTAQGPTNSPSTSNSQGTNTSSGSGGGFGGGNGPQGPNGPNSSRSPQGPSTSAGVGPTNGPSRSSFGRALNAGINPQAETPAYSGGMDYSAADPRSIGRSTNNAFRSARASAPNNPGLRGLTGPNGEPRPQPAAYGTNYQTAQMMRSAYPSVAARTTQTGLTEALDEFSRAIPGEAGINTFGRQAMPNIARVGLNQIVGGYSPEKMVAGMDTTGKRPATRGFENPGPNSMGMVAPNSPDAVAGAISLQNAIQGKGVSPEAMDASNFVAAGTPMVRGVDIAGAPVMGTQFGKDSTWGNRISRRNNSAAPNIASITNPNGTPGSLATRPNTSSMVAGPGVPAQPSMPSAGASMTKGIGSLKEALTKAPPATQAPRELQDYPRDRVLAAPPPGYSFETVVNPDNTLGRVTVKNAAKTPTKAPQDYDPLGSLSYKAPPQSLQGVTPANPEYKAPESLETVRARFADPNWKAPPGLAAAYAPVKEAISLYNNNKGAIGVLQATGMMPDLGVKGAAGAMIKSVQDALRPSDKGPTPPNKNNRYAYSAPIGPVKGTMVGEAVTSVVNAVPGANIVNKIAALFGKDVGSLAQADYDRYANMTPAEREAWGQRRLAELTRKNNSSKSYASKETPTRTKAAKDAATTSPALASLLSAIKTSSPIYGGSFS